MKLFLTWRHFLPALMVFSTFVLHGQAQTPGPTAASGATAPRRITTLSNLLASCRPKVPANCSIGISSPTETLLEESAQLLPGIVIHISGKGSWTLNGAALDFAGATIDAPADRPILSGSARLTGLSAARPEWFAPTVDNVYPASALAAAYRAIQPGGVILLAAHTYLSPFFDPASPGSCGGTTILLDTSLTLIGSGRPHPDDDTAPTRLLEGTVIRGEICGTGVLRAYHLGVDVGPFTVDRHFGGHKIFGIQLGSTGVLGKVRGTTLEDVAVLTTGMADQHSVIIEGQSNATVRGLWIWTLGGTHGLVMKSSSSTVQNFHCKGASADCLILKSDFDTDHAGEASDDRVDGVFISYLAHPGDTAGIFLDGSWDSLRRVELHHIIEEGLSSGISAFDSLFHEVAYIHIADWSATGITGTCLILNGTNRVLIERFTCSQNPFHAGPPLLLNGSNALLRGGVIVCKGEPCRSPAEDGVVDRGHKNRVESLRGDNLGGYLVRTSPHRLGTAVSHLETSRMDGRTSAPYLAPKFSFSLRLAGWIALVKQTTRIIVTRAITSHPWLHALQRPAA